MAFMATYIFYKILNKSTSALLLQAMKESEDRVKFLGYDTFLIKYSAFVISTSLSALGGAMLALSNTYVGATTYAPEHNGEVVVMSMLGGPASILEHLWERHCILDLNMPLVPTSSDGSWL
jgi:branched-chain amino acid transport system permease protein